MRRQRILPNVAWVVLHRKDQHLRIRRFLDDLGGYLDAALVRKADVQKDDVRLVLTHLEDGVPRIPGLGHGLEALLRGEQHAEPRADDGVVVDDHDPSTEVVARAPCPVLVAGADITERIEPTPRLHGLNAPAPMETIEKATLQTAI